MKLNRFLFISICILFVIEAVAQEVNNTIKWQIAGQLPAAPSPSFALGVAGPICGVSQHVLLIGGGANFPLAKPWEGGKKKYYDQLCVYKKQGDSLQLISSIFSLPYAVGYAASCTTPTGLFYGGGESEQGLSQHAFLIRWNEKEQKPVFDVLPSLPEAVTNASATYVHHTVYLVGGDTKEGTSKKGWVLDINAIKKGWRELPSLPQPTSYALLLSAAKKNATKLYLIGGRSKTKTGISDLYRSVFEFDVLSATWKKLSDLPVPLSAQAGVMLSNDSFVLFGGEQGTTFSQVEKLLQQIETTTEPTTKQALMQQKNNLLQNHPGFSRTILQYHISSGRCSTIGMMPDPCPVTTAAVWWGHMILIPSGEVRAGIRTPQILSAQLTLQP
jgi:N-acetylneuraminate epimerase